LRGAPGPLRRREENRRDVSERSSFRFHSQQKVERNGRPGPEAGRVRPFVCIGTTKVERSERPAPAHPRRVRPFFGAVFMSPPRRPAPAKTREASAPAAPRPTGAPRPKPGPPRHAPPPKEGAAPHLRFRSQISFRPVRVSRSSTSSISSQKGTIGAARPPVARAVASSPSSSRTRRMIVSTCPAKP
jgi:hypothetical protein